MLNNLVNKTNSVNKLDSISRIRNHSIAYKAGKKALAVEKLCSFPWIFRINPGFQKISHRANMKQLRDEQQKNEFNDPQKFEIAKTTRQQSLDEQFQRRDHLQHLKLFSIYLHQFTGKNELDKKMEALKTLKEHYFCVENGHLKGKFKLFDSLHSGVLCQKHHVLNLLKKNQIYEDSKIIACRDICNKLTNSQDGKERQTLKKMVMNYMNSGENKVKFNVESPGKIDNIDEFLSNRSNFGIADVLKIGHRYHKNKLEQIKASKYQHLALKLGNLELKRKYVPFNRMKTFHGERMFHKRLTNALARWKSLNGYLQKDPYLVRLTTLMIGMFKFNSAIKKITLSDVQSSFESIQSKSYRDLRLEKLSRTLIKFSRIMSKKTNLDLILGFSAIKCRFHMSANQIQRPRIISEPIDLIRGVKLQYSKGGARHQIVLAGQRHHTPQQVRHHKGQRSKSPLMRTLNVNIPIEKRVKRIALSRAIRRKIYKNDIFIRGGEDGEQQQQQTTTSRKRDVSPNLIYGKPAKIGYFGKYGDLGNGDWKGSYIYGKELKTSSNSTGNRNNSKIGQVQVIENSQTESGDDGVNIIPVGLLYNLS